VPCVVPSRHNVFSFSTTRAAALHGTPVAGQRPTRDVAAQSFPSLAVVGLAAHGGVQA